jgi:hypothetical protein
MFHPGFRNVLKWYARFTERVDVFRGDQEFILGDTMHRFANASKRDESSFLIALRGNPNYICLVAVANGLCVRRLPVGATSLGSSNHDRSPGRPQYCPLSTT